MKSESLIEHKQKWHAGIQSELNFWHRYFTTPGIRNRDQYKNRLDPTEPLQPEMIALLPDQEDVHILDVGAGPLTCLGKVDTTRKRNIHITAVDPLAIEYNKILLELDIVPLITTQYCKAEMLVNWFGADYFDMVYCRNALDHSYDPIIAIDQMIQVVKSRHYVFLNHHMNEANRNRYGGLHQWNFNRSTAGDFMIQSRDISVNISEKYRGRHKITTENVDRHRYGHWVTVKIKK